MNRRSLITVAAFAISLFVVLLGVGWISSAALDLVEREAEARRQAAIEENVRLALWRMDSALAPLVANESARPYFTYTSFYPAGRSYDRMFAAVDESEPLIPSPLLDEYVDYVLLHFQIDAQGNVSSPSAPQGKLRSMALRGHLDNEALLLRERRLGELRSILEKENLTAKLSLEEAPDTTVARALAPPKQKAAQKAPPQIVAALTNEAPVQQEQVVQRGKNSNEWMMRSQAVQQASSYNNPGRQSLNAPQNAQADQIKAGLADGNQDRNQGAVGGEDAQKQQVETPRMRSPRSVSVGNVRQGPLTPLWVKGALLLARRVRIQNADFVQGVWLDWSSVRENLLSTVRDLLPEAELRAIEATNQDDQRRLASVPAYLVAGTVSVETPELGTPIRFILAIAWSGVLLAAAAVAALMFGTMALSERRGAFVSAVTHELRTPLTTFRMYSEMLADGMVRDEAKRASYLDTLKKEAVRLSHLVENVLAYARIERGRHTGRVETLPVADTISRVVDRLKDRAAQAKMTIDLHLPEDAGSIRADATAVEQILFNLVDNACKYAATATDRSIRIDVEKRSGNVQFHVRDHGPGIDKKAKRRLFAPFSRSAEAAAGSAPGVGLGLALSRRLARTMGGDLVLEDQKSGASFALTLPAA
jgi:signal transduction histidine kinase